MSPPPYGRPVPPPYEVGGPYSPPTKYRGGPPVIVGPPAGVPGGPPPYEEDAFGRQPRYRELPPHRMPQYEDEAGVRHLI